MKNVIILLALVLTSCNSTKSTILDTWKDPTTSIESENFKKVLVVGLLKNDLIRKRVEDHFKELNPKFRASYPFLNKKSQINQDLLVKLLKSENFDGVITMRLVDTKKEVSYSPSTFSSYYYNPYGYTSGTYGGLFGNWYGNYGTIYYSPGNFVEETYYIVETNIFSLNNDKLIWSAVTKTVQFSDIEGGLDDILKSIENEMRKDGSLPPVKK
jgi:hypothetical protein